MMKAGYCNAEERISRWRILDSGSRSAAENIALDAAMLEMRESDRIPNTVRFLSFSEPSVLIGFNQSLAQEARMDYCLRQGIAMNRRLTGGGAILIDTTQLGWELIAARSDLPAGPVLNEITAMICSVAVKALGFLGIEASFRPRNDIEVEGRKICGTGGVFEDRALLFQGTLLVDFDPADMIKALRIPAEKLSRHELRSARERVTCLSKLLSQTPDRESIIEAFRGALSDTFDINIDANTLSAAEEQRAADLLPSFMSKSWIDGINEPVEERPLLKSVHRGDGGVIRTVAAVDTRRKRISSVCFNGDYFIHPSRAIFDLEARLKGCRFEEIHEKVGSFFEAVQPDCMGLDANDFTCGLKRALEKAALLDKGLPAGDTNSISIIGHGSLEDITERARLLLLPYCAKLPECEFRSMDGCGQCGDCSVADAYNLAEIGGLTPISITNYEHLVDTLDDYRSRGHTAMIGCCCNAFMEKHYLTFATSGMDAVLIDIDNTTCYELSQEEDAYRGDYANHTGIKMDLLRHIVGLRKTPDMIFRVNGFN